MKVDTVGVVGAGQMGAGIAQVFAFAGHNVILQDIKPEFIDRGMNGIKGSLSKLLEKGKITKDVHDRTLANIKTALTLNDLAACDVVVEAAPENIDLKKEIFSSLDNITKKDAILATNTSSISIAKIGEATKRPDKIIGMHFMNPVPIMQCVEVIRSPKTSDATHAVVSELVTKLNKTMVTSKDAPGFIINRILMPMINEAAHALKDGIATREDIDTGMKLSCNFPMGPLALADLIGLDTVNSILTVLYDGFKDEKYRPCTIIKEHVDKGELGRKTKKGFYTY